MKTRAHFGSLIAILVLSLYHSSASAQAPSDYVISGRVFDESNQGVVNVRVCAKPEDYDQVPLVPCNRSDANGNFAIKVGRPAHWTIFPEKTAAGYMWQAVPFYRNPAMPLVKVVLTESNRTASVMVPLGPKNGSLSGKAIDAYTHRPIENIRFTMCQAADPKTCYAKSVKSPSGEFNVGAALVPFTLRITADGYEDWWGLSGSDKDRAISIAAGTRTEVLCLLRRRAEAANRPSTEAEKIPSINLPAPIQLSPSDRAELSLPKEQLAAKNYTRNTKLEWQPVAGAVSYAVEIDFCDGREEGIRSCVDPQPLSLRRNPPASGIVGTSYEFVFCCKQPGRWRVWAVDRNGQEGFKSPWRLFFYLN